MKKKKLYYILYKKRTIRTSSAQYTTQWEKAAPTFKTKKAS